MLTESVTASISRLQGEGYPAMDAVLDRTPVPRFAQECGSRDWYPLQVHPNKEFVAARHLRQQGFEYFLPTFDRTYRGRKDVALRPLFPGYMFVAFDQYADRWTPILSTIGVKALFLKTDGSPKPLPPRTINTLFRQSVLERLGDLPVARIVPGCRAIVTIGPLKQKVGVCLWSTEKRVALLLSVMHGEVSVTFSADVVRRV